MSQVDSNANQKKKLNGLKICRLATVPFFLHTQLHGQVKFLQENGADVTMVSSRGLEAKTIIDSGIPHVTIDIPRAISPWRDLCALWDLYRFFCQQRFDIVHSTTPKAGFITCVASLFAGVPVRLHTFTGQQWVTMSGVTRFVSRLADRLIGFLNTQCYADSKSQRQFLIDEGLLPLGKTKVLGEGSLAGVDLGRFDVTRWSSAKQKYIKQELGISQTAMVLIFIGRISKDKGILELLTAFQQIQEDQQYEVELLLLGPLDNDRGGTGGVKDNLLDGAKIHSIGYHNNPEEFLAVADLLCLPSYREGFGTVVIEAAAMGVPTLGTEINGLIDAVADGETGLLIPARNTEALYEALCSLLDNPFQLEQLGNAAHKRCAVLFDSSVVNALLVDDYIKLLKFDS